MKKYSYWVLTSALAVTLVFAGFQAYRANAYEREVEANYNRAFFELADYVDNINTLLTKGLVSNSPTHFSALASELAINAASAKECMAQLPVSEISLDNTAKFLSQVGDYSFALSKNALNNQPMNDEEYNNLVSLAQYAESLSASLNSLQDSVYNGDLRFVKNPPSNVAFASVADGFSAIEKDFANYPSLIYDGPFSEHIDSREPALLKGAEEISSEQAGMIATEFFGRKSGFISYTGEMKNSTVDCYTFTANSNQKSISITKLGGYILYYMNSRRIDGENISYAEALAAAEEFLKKYGYMSMAESYHETKNGSVTINFAYSADGVIYYSDLVKVKVALDNGEVIGVEAKGYIMNHYERNLPQINLSRQQSRAKIMSQLAIDSCRLAMIPKDSAKEVLCYEFKGSALGKNFLIYINAETGREEEILILIESDTGVLTV